MPELLSQLLPFLEALTAHQGRVLLPTSLDTKGIRKIDPTIRRNSIFSAETLVRGALEEYKTLAESLLNPVQVRHADRVTPENPEGWVTEGVDESTARLRMKELWQKFGYTPNPDERGSLRDLSSDRRINLVLETQVEMMQGAGHFMQAQDPAVLDAYPAQELVRFTQPKTKGRDWPSRWRLAAVRSGDADALRVLNETMRMIARKDSPIWDAIGSSALFDDGLDNPYPPFAFGSGMWVQDVDFETAEQLGLVKLSNVPEPQTLDIESLLSLASE